MKTIKICEKSQKHGHNRKLDEQKVETQPLAFWVGIKIPFSNKSLFTVGITSAKTPG